MSDEDVHTVERLIDGLKAKNVGVLDEVFTEDAVMGCRVRDAGRSDREGDRVLGHARRAAGLAGRAGRAHLRPRCNHSQG